VRRAAIASAVAGLAALVATGLLAMLDPRTAAYAWVAAFLAVQSALLGGVVLLMISHVAPIRWIAAGRPLLEAMAGAVPLLFPAFAPICLAVPVLYPMARPLWFDVRAVAILATWSIAALALRRVDRSRKLVSALLLPVIAISWSIAAFDWGLALDAPVPSSVYPLYAFSGGFAAALAALAVASRLGALEVVLPPDATYALGRLVLAFCFFWAYIAYGQLLVTWIADLRTDHGWLAPRMHAWLPLTWALFAFQFGIPFAALLPYEVRRSATGLALVSAVALVGHALDAWWLVLPSASPAHMIAPAVALTSMAALVALFTAATAIILGFTRGEPVEPTLAYRPEG
jgi:hypothetical protein